jgi:large subunit ribosomal protein L32
MAVPKKRTTATRQGQRRSHLALKPVALVACSNCTKPTRPHIACEHCGMYRGRKVVNV